MLSETISKLIEELKKEVPADTTSITIFINTEESTVTISQRSAAYLKDNNISMRNVAGKWIN